MKKKSRKVKKQALKNCDRHLKNKPHKVFNVGIVRHSSILFCRYVDTLKFAVVKPDLIHMILM